MLKAASVLALIVALSTATSIEIPSHWIHGDEDDQIIFQSEAEHHLFTLLTTSTDAVGSGNEEIFDSAWNALDEDAQVRVSKVWLANAIANGRSRLLQERSSPGINVNPILAGVEQPIEGRFSDDQFKRSALSSDEFAYVDEDLVQTVNGPVRGLVFPRSKAFLNIPYGEDTSGPNRFMDPIPVSSWGSEPIDGTEFGPGCYQHCGLPEGTCPYSISEDCLTIDVYTPRDAASRVAAGEDPLPIMFWIYGGRFESGTIHCELYLGQRLAERANVVLIMPNYRIAAFGFLSTKDRPWHGGFVDQQLALQWVQDNGASFGGDTSNVMIFGQSAGGLSVASHIVSPSSQGLFARAAQLSSPMNLPFKTPSSSNKIGKAFAKALDCKVDDLECYQSADVDDVLRASSKAADKRYIRHILDNFLPWTPIIGHQDLPDPWKAQAAGDMPGMEYIMGVTSEEGIPFVWQVLGKPCGSKTAKAVLTGLFGRSGMETFKRYDDDREDKRFPVSDCVTDFVFRCPNRITARAAANVGPTWMWDYDQVLSFPGWGTWTECDNHACHGVELPYVFNTPDASEDPAKKYYFTEEEAELSRNTQDFLANFAYSGSPTDGPHEPPMDWPPYGDSDEWMIFHAGNTRVEAEHLKEACDYMESKGYFKEVLGQD